MDTLPSCSHLPLATGMGLRAAHPERVRSEQPKIDWLEVHTENFLGGGATPSMLEALRGRGRRRVALTAHDEQVRGDGLDTSFATDHSPPLSLAT